MVESAENSSQIVELMAQVHVNDTAAGLFLPPEASQDYKLDCLGNFMSSRQLFIPVLYRFYLC